MVPTRPAEALLPAHLPPRPTAAHPPMRLEVLLPQPALPAAPAVLLLMTIPTMDLVSAAVPPAVQAPPADPEVPLHPAVLHREAAPAVIRTWYLA